MASSKLYACPFCRELFEQDEVEKCPACDIAVVPLDTLGPSHEAEALEPEPPVAPEYEVLAWTYLGRNRGLLMLISAGGAAAFFAPWLHQGEPYPGVLSGFEFARALGWLWAAGIAWFIMFALVASRRTIYHMRGSRLAVIILAAMVFVTVVARLVLTPKSGVSASLLCYVGGWWLYAAGALAIAAIIVAIRFGGSLADMPTQQPRQGDETLH